MIRKPIPLTTQDSVCPICGLLTLGLFPDGKVRCLSSKPCPYGNEPIKVQNASAVKTSSKGLWTPSACTTNPQEKIKPNDDPYTIQDTMEWIWDNMMKNHRKTAKGFISDPKDVTPKDLFERDFVE